MKKTNLILFLLILTFSAYSQLKTDTSVKKRYELALQQLPADVKAQINTNDTTADIEGYSFGILVGFRIDTLNKAEYRQSTSKVVITDIDESFGSTGEVTFPAPAPCRGFVSGDTLVIQTGLLAPSQWVKILRSKIVSYQNIEDEDSTFKANLANTSNKGLKLPVPVVKLTLSNERPALGETVYGEAEYVNTPKAVKDRNFKRKYLKQQTHYHYLFKIKIIKKP